MSYILETGLTSKQRADATAADVQRAEWERAKRIDMPAAIVAFSELRALQAARSTTGTLYTEFRTQTLGFTVRFGYEWDGPSYHAHHPQTSGTELTEVWVMGEEIGHHLTDQTRGFLHNELTAHLIANAKRERSI